MYVDSINNALCLEGRLQVEFYLLDNTLTPSLVSVGLIWCVWPVLPSSDLGELKRVSDLDLCALKALAP